MNEGRTKTEYRWRDTARRDRLREKRTGQIGLGKTERTKETDKKSESVRETSRDAMIIQSK